MKFNRHILLISFFAASFFVNAQNKLYKQKFTEGNFLILEKNYGVALKSFLEAYNIDSSSANINYKVGLCYLNSSSEKQKAYIYLEKAVKNTTKFYKDFEPSEKKAPVQAHYYLAQAYAIANKFNESAASYETFKGLGGATSKELKEMEVLQEKQFNALEMIRNPVNVQIDNLGDSINTEYPEYSAIVSADEMIMIFTSRRPGSTGGEKTIEDLFYEDIYYSSKRTDGSWSEAKSIGPSINSNGNEASVSLSADGQQLFIFKDINGGDLFYSNLDGDKWSTPLTLGPSINSIGWESHACLSSDGNTIYFVSNREGGFGGRDIYRSVRLPNGEWSLPLNLGATINTPYDEDTPFIHPDGVSLYFSSQGHKGMGGFDVFYSTRSLEESNKWSSPVNIGYPVNTAEDDLFYLPTADAKHAYVSGVKAGGKGDKDIYRITTDAGSAVPVTLLKGYLTYDGQNAVVNNVKITVIDLETGHIEQEARPNTKTAKYVLILRTGVKGKTYTVTYEAEGYQPISETVKIETGSAFQELEREIPLKSINFESKKIGTVSVNGTITNKDGKPLPGAKISIKDNLTGNLIDTYYSNATEGGYYFVLNRGMNYYLSYEAEGYLFQSENVNVPVEPVYSEINKVIVLDPIQTGTKITLKNLFFDSGKSTIRKESRVELEKLYSLMKENTTLVIEISGHTDNKGNQQINLKLSLDRAKAVVAYLVKKGIDPKRLVAKGYGDQQPVASNTLPNGKPDPAGMQKNRRVEMKVLESK